MTDFFTFRFSSLDASHSVVFGMSWLAIFTMVLGADSQYKMLVS